MLEVRTSLTARNVSQCVRWPRFSIIIPAFNAAQTIKRCVDSVFSQDVGNYEILVVDDASTDGTVDLVRGYRDSRLVLIESEKNGGPALCRNRALDRAIGSFIVFVDADDWLDPHFLTAAQGQFEATDELDYLAVRYLVVREDGTSIDRQDYSGGDPLRAFLEDRIVSSAWAKVFRKSIIEAHHIRFPNIRYMEDSVFNATFLRHARSAALLNRVLYHFEKRNASATTGAFRPAVVNAIEKGLALTAETLGAMAPRYSLALSARQFRMLGVNGIRRLAEDLRGGRRDPAVEQWYRRYLLRRFEPHEIMTHPNLSLREKAIYLIYLAAPLLALRLAAARP